MIERRLKRMNFFAYENLVDDNGLPGLSNLTFKEKKTSFFNGFGAIFVERESEKE